MNKLLALVLLAAYTAAGPTNVAERPSQDLNCLEQDKFFSCIFVKTASVLNRAARSNDIEIADGITFVRVTPMERIGKSLEINEVEIMNELPRESTDRMMELYNMLYNSAVSFMKSHSLKVNMPEDSNISRALNEGRAKIKKMVLPLIAAAGLKVFALVPILLGGLGLLVLKALVFGKIALIIASIIAFQRLFGGSNVASSFFNKNPASLWYDNAAAGNWVANGSPLQHQGYRSFNSVDEKVDAHNLAYSAHAPAATTDTD
ncbi:uncharacterized protein LOC118645302 [Monomorium pharaonis]|uniref:uncharacterized protein LOC105828937 n=1 Tax=Monomorium pharaonis TaxID=307658 RepID=UPI00063F40BA|nr:uncharacterized protein LOC105828937 [Monomorium pharaonis]XP_036142028.1 uncharacterized protein LOC118645302 [Monomorium pharaonis]